MIALRRSGRDEASAGIMKTGRTRRGFPGTRRVGGWNQAVLGDPGFQGHLALRFVSQRAVAAMCRDLAEQAKMVLERADALLR
jgi:hypothetical protein